MEDPPLPWLQKYNYVCNAETPDIIGLPDSDVGHHFERWAKYRQALSCRRRYGQNPVLFNITGELHRPFYGADFTLSYEPASRNNCLYHYMLYRGYYRSAAMVETSLERRGRKRSPFRDGFLLCRLALRNLHRECRHLLSAVYTPLRKNLPWMQRVRKFRKLLRQSEGRFFSRSMKRRRK